MDPGLVEIGRDYRLRSDAPILKHFMKGATPGPFPVAQ